LNLFHIHQDWKLVTADERLPELSRGAAFGGLPQCSDVRPGLKIVPSAYAA
jgi:hypothetical protein